MNIVTRLDGDGGVLPMTTITLSRSNLKSLLVQLDSVAGTRETAQIMRRTEENGLLIVIAEENDTHYGDDRVAGISDGSDVRWLVSLGN